MHLTENIAEENIGLLAIIWQFNRGSVDSTALCLIDMICSSFLV